MRLLFYAINGVGLGHVRRLLLIAEEVRRQRPEAHILFITNSAFPQMIEERGFPCIRLPSEVSPTAESHFPIRTITAGLHDQLFLSLARHFSPDAIVFDTAWSWEQLEFAKRNGIRTILILRKATNEHMAHIAGEWKRFDLICVAHTENEFASLGAPKRIISHLKKLGAVFAGPVVPDGQRSKRKTGSTFRILVTAGGGGWPTTQRFLDDVSTGLAAVLKAHDDISAEIVAGPLFKGTLNALPGRTVHRYLENSELLEHMRESHLAIAKAGYNTCNDLVATGLPALLVPAQREIESQEERARYFQKAGCARVVQCKPEAIRRAVEQLYRNRSSLEKMRKACASALGRPGTPAIAGRIISIMPQVTRVSLGRARRLKAADFVVAKGTLSKKARGQLLLLRKRAGFLLLETGPAWLTCPESVKELRALVDAVALQLTRQQAEKLASGRMPTGLRAAITLLKESGPYFEFRIPTTPRLAKKMATVLKQLHREGCPQIQFYIASSIKDRMLEKPLSEVRRFLLSSRGENARVYCSHTSLVPSEFPKGRLLYYQQEQMAREMKREQAALMRRQVAERRAQEARERKLLKERREAEQALKTLEKSKTVKHWHEERSKCDALGQELTSQPRDWSSVLDEMPAGLDKELMSRWLTLLQERSAVEKEIAEKQDVHLSPVERELDALFLEQDAFKEGKATGVTWRQLDLKRQRLISRHRSQWMEHLSALDEHLKRIDARKRELADALTTALEELTARKQETLKRYMQECKILSQNKEVKRYVSLKKQLERLDRRIAALDEKIGASSAEKTI